MAEQHTTESAAPVMHLWVEPFGDRTACGIRWWNGTRGAERVTCGACVAVVVAAVRADQARRQLEVLARDIPLAVDQRVVDAGENPAGPWIDKYGDVWTLGADGLLHTPETRPFPREHVEKKWGPLCPFTDPEEANRG